MKLFFIGVVILSVFLISAQSAQALIFLPALILIPIAKIIGVVIAGLSLPAFSVGALYSYLFKKSVKRSLLSATGILLIIACLVMIVLKIMNPDRPLF